MDKESKTTHCPSSPSPDACSWIKKWTSFRTSLKKKCHIFTTSKGVLLILLWNIIVGLVYGGVVFASLALSLSLQKRTGPFVEVIYKMLGANGILALIQIFLYPAGGLIADRCCGRYRVVTLSIFSIWCASLLLGIVDVVYLTSSDDHGAVHIATIVLLSIVAFFSLIGISGFQANAVQFGLDHLLDASSNELSVFLHWFIWTDSLGQLVIRFLGAASPCSDFVTTKLLPYAAITFMVIISVLMVLSCCKHQWFHNEPLTHNPYGTVYRVLKFAAKHDKPLRRSALTYCDDERPTRIEFAKQRYGGPFTTEMVEDVKTFLRILIMLFIISPIFILLATLNTIFPLYGIHLGNSTITNKNGCSPEWMLLQSGNLSYLVAVIFIPPYIVFVHPRIPRWMPRILYRLSVGVILMFISVVAMFVTQVLANYDAVHQQERNITCLFIANIHECEEMLNFSPRLVLIIPNLLTGLGFPLVYITILEFISAQSPHTMKGLLLGVFYAFRGFFILVGTLLVYPFGHHWEEDGGSTQITGCGFYYFLLSTILGLIGFATIPAAIKWYQYRVREDKPYGPSYVEDYYSRYFKRMNTQLISEVVAEDEDLLDLSDGKKSTSYGSIHNNSTIMY